LIEMTNAGRDDGVRGVLAVPRGNQPLLRAQTYLLAVLTPAEALGSSGQRPQVGSHLVVLTAKWEPTSALAGLRAATTAVFAVCRGYRPVPQDKRNWPEREGSIASRRRPGSSTPSLIEAAHRGGAAPLALWRRGLGWSTHCLLRPGPRARHRSTRREPRRGAWVSQRVHEGNDVVASAHSLRDLHRPRDPAVELRL
jgi:hypothetical protein